jgi:hypothetical protein
MAHKLEKHISEKRDRDIVFCAVERWTIPTLITTVSREKLGSQNISEQATNIREQRKMTRAGAENVRFCTLLPSRCCASQPLHSASSRAQAAPPAVCARPPHTTSLAQLRLIGDAAPALSGA